MADGKEIRATIAEGVSAEEARKAMGDLVEKGIVADVGLSRAAVEARVMDLLPADPDEYMSVSALCDRLDRARDEVEAVLHELVEQGEVYRPKLDHVARIHEVDER